MELWLLAQSVHEETKPSRGKAKRWDPGFICSASCPRKSPHEPISLHCLKISLSSHVHHRGGCSHNIPATSVLRWANMLVWDPRARDPKRLTSRTPCPVWLSQGVPGVAFTDVRLNSRASLFSAPERQGHARQVTVLLEAGLLTRVRSIVMIRSHCGGVVPDPQLPSMSRRQYHARHEGGTEHSRQLAPDLFYD